MLLGDDGVGPFVIETLKSEYDFPDNVELADLGMPALDLFVHFAGAEAAILVHAANFGGAPGDIRLFHKQDILRNPARARLDPHGLSLSESMSLFEFVGAIPSEFLMIGMQGGRFEPGPTLSTPVRHCIVHIIDAVQRELRRLNVSYTPKKSVKPPRTWLELLGLRATDRSPRQLR